MPRSIYLFTEAIQNFNAIKLLRDEIVTFWTPLPLSSSCKRCETPEVGRGTSLYCNNEQCSSGKYKIKRKLRFKSNTWPWQRLRICLNSLLKQGEKSFSLLKRILHYTRCTIWRRAIIAFTTQRRSLSSILRKSLKCLCKQIPENCSLKELVNICRLSKFYLKISE